MNNLTNDFDETLSIDCHLLDNVESCVRYLGPEHSFTCLTFNIRSIQHNFDSFLVTLKRLNISLDVIVLTECWLSENSIIPQLPGYVSYRTHKYINKSGGVIAYIKDSTNACVNESACEECNCLEINLEGDTLVLAHKNPTDLLKTSPDPISSLNHCNTLFTNAGKNLADKTLKEFSITVWHHPRTISVAIVKQ
ncbi:hypothetical protein ABMA27_001907 [Loxostege sticticalis]|uniref:Uncharacterized protein n=1 Tax=Loxostege sticticalis TaxID=481309 RepID=A0ABR3HVV0_LOXSC